MTKLNSIIEKILFKFGYEKIRTYIPEWEIDLIDVRVCYEAEIRKFTEGGDALDVARMASRRFSDEMYKLALENVGIEVDYNCACPEGQYVANIWFKVYPMMPKKNEHNKEILK